MSVKAGSVQPSKWTSQVWMTARAATHSITKGRILSGLRDTQCTPPPRESKKTSLAYSPEHMLTIREVKTPVNLAQGQAQPQGGWQYTRFSDSQELSGSTQLAKRCLRDVLGRETKPQRPTRLPKENKMRQQPGRGRGKPGAASWMH